MPAFCVFHEAAASAAVAMGHLFGATGFRDSVPNDTRTVLILAGLLLLITAPLDLSQLVFALVGAAAYALLQATHLTPTQRPAPHDKGSKAANTRGAAAPHPSASGACAATAPAPSLPQHRRPSWNDRRAPRAPPHGGGSPVVTHTWAPAAPGPCAVPVPAFVAVASPPRPAATGWDAEVQELLDQISPTSESSMVVKRLARLVKQSLRRLAPNVEVSGFSSGDLVRGPAFGVAVPEVDIVVHVNFETLATRMQGRGAAKNPELTLHADMRKLQKSAIRHCTDRLVSQGGFKFRRSAFRGQEPKVTLLAPASLGLFPEAIPIDFSINATTPLYNSVVVTGCGRLEPRLKHLVLLVKRWAKDRGVCHAAKGHLSPYAWTLLAVYFMQVGASEDGPLLPPLEGAVAPSPLDGQAFAPSLGEAARRWVAWTDADGKTPARLFQDFVRFYSRSFDWTREAVSARRGRRRPPDALLPVHMVTEDDGRTKVGPFIEDPFEPARNLGECTTARSLERMHEELQRADRICSAGPDASLAELLELWVPPDRSSVERAGQQDDEDAKDAEESAPREPPCPKPALS